ncbi:hypothetical protein [Microbulbifer pacificus]|uniref:hypothetical protein n=1 Tax=Microbulbifer pacificus TaxID=407164 RepID=UPI000CF4E738|nr:hypothetical protein [Microbulbifer pacificus]
MFSQIKALVDLVKTGATEYSKHKKESERSESVLEMLRVYFLIKDCVEDGEELVSESEPNPVEVISRLSPDMALLKLEKWDRKIRRQGLRLYRLSGDLLGQDHISVVNPELQDKLADVVGYKMNRTVTLHGIGAALFFKEMFPIENTAEEKARYISIMAGEEGDNLNMERIRSEIEDLKQALVEFRSVVDKFVSPDEILRLAKVARQETRFEESA